MTKYFKMLITVIIIVDVFILFSLAFIIWMDIQFNSGYNLLFTTLLFIVALFVAGIVETILIGYYKDVVVQVSFDSDNNVLLQTHTRLLSLPSKNFKKVIENRGCARTYLIYDDGTITKTYIYQMRYSPLKSHYLNIDDMKKHMPYTEFC